MSTFRGQDHGKYSRARSAHRIAVRRLEAREPDVGHRVEHVVGGELRVLRKLMMWVGGLNTDKQICRHVADAGYLGFRLDDAEPAQPPVPVGDAPSSQDLTAAAATP